MIYNKLVEDCFFSIEHQGILDGSYPDTVSCRSDLPGGSSAMVLSIQCEPQGSIRRACFKARGNPYMIAAMEWICRQLEGESISHHPRISYQDLVKAFDIPNTQYPVALRVEHLYRDVIETMNNKLKEVKK